MDETQPLLKLAGRNVVNVVLEDEGRGKRSSVAGAAVFHRPSDNAERNVVILGKVGTGKRTLGNHIIGTDVFHSGEHSADTKCHYEEWQSVQNMLCRILIVHTESLQTDHLTQYIRQQFERIHLVIFVISTAPYNDVIKRSLMCAIGSLHPRAKRLCALVITRCDGFKDDARQKTIDHFRCTGVCRDVAKFVGKSIYTVGFSSVSNKARRASIAKDEKAIRQLVKNSEYPLSVQDALTLPNSCSRCKASIKSCFCCCIFQVS